MRPFVVDANVMNYFQAERLSEPGLAHEALESIFINNHIALDEEGQCRQEWIDCAAGTYPLALADWVNDRLVEQKIRLYRLTKDSMHKQLTCLGIPKKDHKWIRLAVGCEAKGIVTEDIDLIAPRKKNCGAMVRASIMKSCSGPVATFLKKCFGLRVMCCSHVKDYCTD